MEYLFLNFFKIIDYMFNYGNNILTLFDALPKFLFTMSETKSDY